MKKILILTVLIVVSLSIGNIPIDELDSVTLLYSRFPRLVAIILTGIGISVSGLVMQKIMHSNYVSPSMVGTIEGGKLGYLISLIFFQTTLLEQSIIVFVCSLGATLLFILLKSYLNLKNILVPIVGLILTFIISSFNDFIIYYFDLSHSVNSWLTGNFSTIIASNYEMLYIILILVLLLLMANHYIDIVSLGEDMATNFGVNYKLVVTVSTIVISAISSTVLLTVGIVPLLGLVVPNIVRYFYGEKTRSNIYLVSYYGVIMLLISDIMSRVIIFPYEMPISITTTILGTIVFGYILVRMVQNDKL